MATTLMVSQKVHLRRCAATSSLRSDLRALYVGASCTRPIMGVRPDAPTIETIFSATFYEIINIENPTDKTLWAFDRTKSIPEISVNAERKGFPEVHHKTSVFRPIFQTQWRPWGNFLHTPDPPRRDRI
jgi:hypothetical protein